MTTRADVVSVARSYIGTPWRHQGRKRGVGVDCLGLIGMTAYELGLPGASEWLAFPGFHDYGRIPNPHLLLGGCDSLLQRIQTHTAREGDILVMAFSKDPQHFAVVSGCNPVYIVHAYAQARRVVENGVAVAKARVLRAYQFRGLDA